MKKKKKNVACALPNRGQRCVHTRAENAALRVHLRHKKGRQTTCKCPAQILVKHTSPWRRAQGDYVVVVHGVRTGRHNLNLG